VRWNNSGTESGGYFIFYYGKENENHRLGARFLVRKRIVLVILVECVT
jgi:hypothetical protein